MSTYHTKPAALAESFRHIAAELEKLVDVEVSQFVVDLTLQVSSWQKNSPEQEEERIAAVRTLMAALTPHTPADIRPSSELFGTPATDPVINGIDVCIFTALGTANERRLRAENKRLREQLTKAGVQA